MAELCEVALRVRDLRAMEAFYGSVGFSVAWRESPEVVHFELAQVRLILRLEEAVAKRGALLHLGISAARPSDVDAVVRALEAAGVRVASPPSQAPDGSYVAELLDPEGNAVRIVCRS